MSKKLNDLSRAVSHALRHEPWLYELELDDEGWTNVDELLAALRQGSSLWQDLAQEDVAEMIHMSSKKRHEIVNGRIRALYGHSVPGKLRRIRAEPPDVLFHGTAPTTVPMIRRRGLLPMKRQYVHLSVDRGVATSVGQRKAQTPVILVVKAQEAFKAGIDFYAGNENVWLADQVPPDYIEFEDH